MRITEKGKELLDNIRAMDARTTDVAEKMGGIETDVQELKERLSTMDDAQQREAIEALEARLAKVDEFIAARPTVGINVAGEANRYSLVRSMGALREMARGRSIDDAFANAPYEREVYEASRNDYEAVERARAATASNDSSLGLLVPDEYMDGVIEKLRERMVLDRLGVTEIPSLEGGKAIWARETGDGTFGWVGETQERTGGTDPTADTLELRPHTAYGRVDVSNRLLRQSNGAAERFVNNQLSKRLARAIQAGFFQGTGSSAQPLGTMNSTGINTVDFGSAAPTVQKLRDMQKAVAVDDADVGVASWVMTPGAKFKIGDLTYTDSGGPILTGPAGGNMANADGPRLLGDEILTTNSITTASNITDIVYAVWETVVMGMWGAAVLRINTQGANWHTNQTIMRLEQDVDFGLMHAESVCVGQNVDVS